MNDKLDVVELDEVEAIAPDAIDAIDALLLVEIDDDAMWLASGEIPDTPGVKWTYPKCPNPTRWKVVGQARSRGSFRLVSSAVSAKAAAVTHTFSVQRSVTFSAAVTAGMKVGLPMLEHEVGITLETSVTVQTGETVTYRIPKGQAMALFAGAGYIVRKLQRVAYGSAMCNRVVQTTEVTSPYMRILEVRKV